ncbi:acyl-CoA dehydrogenase family protein, partial [Actinomadura mexicana]|uniref:acyl-CoA dehydrogenase family protein n=1 Tax=Actinomadura mexicana TaxID=134959 RepID=UPI003CCBDF00
MLLSVRCRRLAALLDTCPPRAGTRARHPCLPAGSIGAMSTDFPTYAPSEEHELLRRSVRELAEAKIAPFAAEVDEESRFPQEAL